MRAEAIVDLSAIKHNVSLLKERAGVNLLAVVKADAYGHGLVPVAKAAVDAGASMLGVALLEEAIALREAGITAPILAWLVQPGSDFKSAIDLDIDLAAGSIKALHEIQEASHDKSARVHLELDTGMTRGGFLNEWAQLEAADVAGLEIVGVFSHFARADEPAEQQNLDQLARFNEMVSTLRSFGFTDVVRHLANSAATLTNPAASFEMVRTGIAMYGFDARCFDGKFEGFWTSPSDAIAISALLSKGSSRRNSSWIRCIRIHNSRHKVGCGHDGICRWNSTCRKGRRGLD